MFYVQDLLETLNFQRLCVPAWEEPLDQALFALVSY